MKKSHSFIQTIYATAVAFLIIGFSSCRTTMPIAEQGGKANVGYLIITSEKKYANKTVEVNVNNGEAMFTVKASKNKSNSKAYQISTGKKSIVVTKGNDVLYNGVIMLYPQETKIITLKQ